MDGILKLLIDEKQLFRALIHAKPEQFDKLIELNLWDNQLRSLPAEIGKLSNLTELDLSYNQLRSLPVEIGKLDKLVELNLVQNKFSKKEQMKIRKLLPNCVISF